MKIADLNTCQLLEKEGNADDSNIRADHSRCLCAFEEFDVEILSPRGFSVEFFIGLKLTGQAQGPNRMGSKALTCGQPLFGRKETVKSCLLKYIETVGVLWFASTLALAQTTASIPGLPGALNWQNKPQSWNLDSKNVLTISANAKSDWFVDPFDGTITNSAPILLFTPGPDYVLSARVTVKFATKWDAGALMVMGDDHHWAKLSFEFSPDGKPTLVTVVTRGLSDDCNSVSLPGDSVYLRIAKSGKTYVFYFSTDGQNWQILRTFSLDSDIPVRVGFESQSPAGPGATAKFSDITYDPHRTGNIYK